MIELRLLSLLQIKNGAWIVHVNSPYYGHCIAVQATGEYGFDAGISVSWQTEMGSLDFNNYIPVNPATIVEFERNDPNVLPSFNLSPRRRIQRVLAASDFLESLDNLRSGKNTAYAEGLRGLADKLPSLQFTYI